MCDDDRVASDVIADILRRAGFDVVAEVANPIEAVDIIEQYRIEELVLDISLDIGSGIDVLTGISERGLPCRVIVFTAFADDPTELLHLGADAVILKPDFPALEALLAEHVVLAPGMRVTERRRPIAPRSQPLTAPPAPGALVAVLEAMTDGDAILAFSLQRGLDDLERVVRSATRDGDLVCRADEGETVAVLSQPDPGALSIVFARVVAALEAEGLDSAALVAVATIVRGDPPRRELLARVLGALHGGRPGLDYV